MTERKPYRPSNGTKGADFMARYCNRCAKDDDESCGILARTILFYEYHPEYPVEWIYDADNRPCCTAFDDVGDPDGVSVAVADDRTADLFGGGR